MKNAEKENRKQLIEKTLSIFSDLDLKMVKDEIGSYSKEANLYYLHVFDKSYLVFNHYCLKDGIVYQGFDWWLSFYKKEDEIGKKKPLKVISLKLNFQIDDPAMGTFFHRLVKDIYRHK